MRNLVYVFLFSFLAANAQTRMSDAEAVALQKLVKEQALSTQTISSDFTQYKHMDFLSNDIESSGKLSFKAPDLVKWEYLKPFVYSVLFKDEKLYINNEGDKSNVDLGSNKLFKQLGQLIADSIKGDMFDSHAFHIAYFKKEMGSEVHFAPKDPNFLRHIKEFQLNFNPKGEVTEIKMVEPSEDYTRIVLSDRKTNQSIADAVFDH